MDQSLPQKLAQPLKLPKLGQTIAQWWSSNPSKELYKSGHPITPAFAEAVKWMMVPGRTAQTMNGKFMAMALVATYRKFGTGSNNPYQDDNINLITALTIAVWQVEVGQDVKAEAEPAPKPEKPALPPLSLEDLTSDTADAPTTGGEKAPAFNPSVHTSPGVVHRSTQGLSVPPGATPVPGHIDLLAED